MLAEFMKKVKCCHCKEKDAVWFYLPGSMKNGNEFCDDCVPRGCDCNVHHRIEIPMEPQDEPVIYWNEDITKWTKELTADSVYYESVDEKGRRFPCCEFDYDPEGLEIDDIE